jgi:hypothetical protein
MAESRFIAEEAAVAAERFFQRSGQTKFPTVRWVARSIKCKHSEIAEAESEGFFCLDGVNVIDWKLGDLEVYVLNPPSP